MVLERWLRVKSTTVLQDQGSDPSIQMKQFTLPVTHMCTHTHTHTNTMMRHFPDLFRLRLSMAVEEMLALDGTKASLEALNLAAGH